MFINIFNLTTKKKVKTIQIDIIGVNRENRKNKYCVFSLDNNLIIEIYKNQIKYFNIRSGLLENTVTFLTDFIVLSPKQDIVVGYDSSKIKIFNINGEEISFPIDNAFSVYKIVFCPDGNKIALISSENISIFNIQKGIKNHTNLWNMVTRPLTQELIVTSLLSQNRKITLQKFIAKILSNYSYFKKYLENNDLIGKFNTTHFMNIILNSTLNLHQNDFSMFINNIIKFINSTPYKVILGEDPNASMLIKYYLNIIREYLLYLYYHYQK
jgi:WD40 repeat protein